MILTPKDCPSNGLDPDSPSISFRPMGYQDLLTYSKELAEASHPIKRFLIDFQWFRKYVPNWKTINVVDLEYCIFRWKLNSVSQESEFSLTLRCPECGKTQHLSLNLTDLGECKKIDYFLGGTVKLGNPERDYEIKACSAEVFLDVLTKCSTSRRVTSIDTIKLISMFPEFKASPNQIERLVLEANHDDVRVLELVKTMYLETYVTIRSRCLNCHGGGWSMRASSLIGDPFSQMVRSSKSIASKISFKQVR